MYYPEVSPTAPVSRDDLAQALMAQQAMGLAGGQQAGDANSMSMDALGAASAPGYGEGAPGPGMGIGRGGGEMSLADPGFGGAMTTSNASMTTSPDAVVGGPFGGRGGADREGFGSNVNDPALASPTLSDPGYSNVSVFGREGDTTSPSSQAAQAAQAAAMAAAAMGRNAVVSDPDALPEGMGGKGDRGYVPGSYTPNFDQVFGAVPSAFPAAVPTTPEDINDMDRAAIAQPSPTFVGRVTPNSYTQPAQTPTPTGRAPLGTPGVPGVPSPDLPSGFDMGSPAPGGTDFGPGDFGGFTSGSGNTAGFGAGYSGSADMGNTQGGAGFTAGAPGGGFDVGAGSFGGGAVGGFGGGDGSGGADGGSGGVGGGGVGGSDGSAGGDNSGGSSGVG